MRRGDAIGTRHSGLTVGNAAEMTVLRAGTAPQHPRRRGPPPASLLAAPVVLLPVPTNNSCQGGGEGRGRSGEGCLGRQPSAQRPALAQTWPDPTSCLPGAAANELALAGPGFSLPCAPPPTGSREKGGWLMPRSAGTLAGSHLAPRKGQCPAPLQAHPTLPTPCFPGHLRQVPRSGASASCPGLPAASV